MYFYIYTIIKNCSSLNKCMLFFKKCSSFNFSQFSHVKMFYFTFYLFFARTISFLIVLPNLICILHIKCLILSMQKDNQNYNSILFHHNLMFTINNSF